MTKVRIRQVISRTRWQLVTFCGKAGAESRGIVDLIALRKDHKNPPAGLKRGDALEIILIQVKGGTAAWPTEEDMRRLQAVAEQLNARHILLASWRKGTAVQFFTPEHGMLGAGAHWKPIHDLEAVFR